MDILLELGWFGDIIYTTIMVVFGASIALILAVLTSMLILGESWPTIRHAVVDENSSSYGILTGTLFVAVCALVGVANRQSITPIWDPSWVERLSFMLAWVIYGQIASIILCYAVNMILFGLSPAKVRHEIHRDRNASVAAVSGLTYLGVSMLVVFRIF